MSKQIKQILPVPPHLLGSKNEQFPESPEPIIRPPTHEEEAKWKIEQERLAKYRMVAIDIWLQGYMDGDINFERMCRNVHKTLENTQESFRVCVLGEVVGKALVTNRKNRGQGNRGEPQCLRKLVRELVTLINKTEDAPLMEQGEKTAFTRTVEVLRAAGISTVTPVMAFNWHYKTRKKVVQ